MPPRNLLARWTELFVRTLIESGVARFVVSPGSRSTPIVLALAGAGAELTVVRDERAAAFFALGMVRVTGRPVAVVCTSGTAPGHYLPAVMEARASRLPLLMITADRPGELHGMAAPQTAAQDHLFGAHAVGYFDLGTPDPAPAALAGLRRVAAQAALRTTYPERGPVQVNLRARRPLEPAPDESPEGSALDVAVAALLARPCPAAIAPATAPHPSAVTALDAALAKSARPLFVCGPTVHLDRARAAEIAGLAERVGAPLLAEAGSQLRFGTAARGVLDGYDVVLRSPGAMAALAPDLVISVDAPPTSAPLLSALAAWSAPRWVLAEAGWPDVDNRAERVLLGPVGALASAVARPGHGGAGDYRARWHAASTRAWALQEDLRASEGEATRAALAGTPDGAVVVLGNSLPIRHVETYAPAVDRGFTVLVQRGVNGIDGLVATATGAARAAGRPVTLLLGDVSLLHDATSLELGQGLATSLVVVVLDNRGGRIFEMLPLAQTPGAPMELFTTPPDVDLTALAAAYRAHHLRVEGPDEVAAAVAEAHRRPGVSVVQVAVPPHGAQEALQELARLARQEWA